MCSRYRHENENENENLKEWYKTRHNTVQVETKRYSLPYCIKDFQFLVQYAWTTIPCSLHPFLIRSLFYSLVGACYRRDRWYSVVFRTFEQNRIRCYICLLYMLYSILKWNETKRMNIMDAHIQPPYMSFNIANTSNFTFMVRKCIF